MKKAINIFYVALAATFLGLVYYVVDYKGLGQRKLSKLLSFDNYKSKGSSSELLLKEATDKINKLEKKLEEHIKDHNKKSEENSKSIAKDKSFTENNDGTVAENQFNSMEKDITKEIRDTKNNVKTLFPNEIDKGSFPENNKESMLDLVKLLAKDNERDMIMKETINLINQKLIYPNNEYKKEEKGEFKKPIDTSMNKDTVLNAFENKFKGNVVDLTPEVNQIKENNFSKINNDELLKKNLNESFENRKQPMDFFGNELFAPFNFTNMQRSSIDDSYDKKIPPYDNISDLTDVMPRQSSNSWHPVFFEPIRRFNDAPKIIPVKENEENINSLPIENIKENQPEKSKENKVEIKEDLKADDINKKNIKTEIPNTESKNNILLNLEIPKTEKKENIKSKSKLGTSSPKKEISNNNHKTDSDDLKDIAFTTTITSNQISNSLDDALVKDIMKEFNDASNKFIKDSKKYNAPTKDVISDSKDLKSPSKKINNHSDNTKSDKKSTKSKKKLSSKKKLDKLETKDIKFENNNDKLITNSTFPFKKTGKTSSDDLSSNLNFKITKDDKNEDVDSNLFQVVNDKKNILIKKDDDGEMIFSTDFPVHNDINAFIENKDEKKENILNNENSIDDTEHLNEISKDDTSFEKQPSQSDYLKLKEKSDGLLEKSASSKNLLESEA